MVPRRAAAAAAAARLAWTLPCLARWSERANRLSHSLQRYGLSPEWLRRWRASSSDLANRQAQSFHVQRYGFSPLCRRRWARTCDAFAYSFPHSTTGQRNTPRSGQNVGSSTFGTILVSGTCLISVSVWESLTHMESKSMPKTETAPNLSLLSVESELWGTSRHSFSASRRYSSKSTLLSKSAKSNIMGQLVLRLTSSLTPLKKSQSRVQSLSPLDESEGSSKLMRLSAGENSNSRSSLRKASLKTLLPSRNIVDLEWKFNSYLKEESNDDVTREWLNYYLRFVSDSALCEVNLNVTSKKVGINFLSSCDIIYLPARMWRGSRTRCAHGMDWLAAPDRAAITRSTIIHTPVARGCPRLLSGSLNVDTPPLRLILSGHKH